MTQPSVLEIEKNTSTPKKHPDDCLTRWFGAIRDPSASQSPYNKRLSYTSELVRAL